MYSQNGYYMPTYTPYMQTGAMPDMLNQMKMPYQQPQQPPTMQIPKASTNDMLWVLNENEATSYPVAPNNSVVLWDKNNPTIYVKSVNAQGVPSIRILDFEERTEVQANTSEKHECKCGDKFVTVKEFESWKKTFYDLQKKCEAMATLNIEKVDEKPKSTTKKEKGD